ncbi:hypothetical protein ACOSQ4_032486 [Xanthoceras sorbifolium]
MDICPLVALRSQTQFQNFEGHKPNSKTLKGPPPFGGSKVTNPAPKLRRSQIQLQSFEGHKPNSKALKVTNPAPKFCLGTFALSLHQVHEPSPKALKGLLPFDCAKAMNPAPKLEGHEPGSEARRLMDVGHSWVYFYRRGLLRDFCPLIVPRP